MDTHSFNTSKCRLPKMAQEQKKVKMYLSGATEAVSSKPGGGLRPSDRTNKRCSPYINVFLYIRRDASKNPRGQYKLINY